MRFPRPLLAILIASAGCDSPTPTGPGIPTGEDPTLLSTVSDIGKVADRAASAPLRVEIEVRRGGPPWIAREVEVEDDRDREEEIESRIAAADASAGTVELVFGGLVIDVAGARRFRVEGVGDVTRDAFFARVESALAAGRRPGVELSRPLPATPQSPDDPGFSAVDVELDGDADVGELEVLIDERHLTVGAAGAGVIRVFGVDIVVDPALGTETRERSEDGDDAIEVEGLVSSVDPGSGRVDLVDGRTFFVVSETRFETDDDDDTLSSLEQVADALSAGHWVEVDAEVVASDDGALIAVEVEFEIEDDADEDDLPGATEVESLVVSADPGAGTFSLANGWTLAIETSTRIDDDGDLRSLAEVADALANGLLVEAEALVVGNGAGGFRLVEVEFELEDGDDGVPGAIEFEGRLATVDVAAGTFKLYDGRTWLVTDATTWESDGDLFSLAAAASAIANGVPVEMEGDAVEDASAPGGLRVVSLKIETDD
ncbi:MAG TPA: DUF5666 domain-containing protein [Longimicrobiales bacterium]|nr:DUF5666 domain-containing protein [Longimicrobiales bacterium]